MILFPIVHEIVGKFESLYFTGMNFDNILLMLVAKKTFFGTLVALFLVQRSFKNLALDGSFWIASRKGMLTLTRLKTSKIFSIRANCFLNLFENGDFRLYVDSLAFSSDSVFLDSSKREMMD